SRGAGGGQPSSNENLGKLLRAKQRSQRQWVGCDAGTGDRMTTTLPSAPRKTPPQTFTSGTARPCTVNSPDVTVGRERPRLRRHRHRLRIRRQRERAASRRKGLACGGGGARPAARRRGDRRGGDGSASTRVGAGARAQGFFRAGRVSARCDR